MYNKNNRGPKTEPCGTPCFKNLRLDFEFKMLTNWERFDKYDLNQSFATPRIP